VGIKTGGCQNKTFGTPTPLEKQGGTGILKVTFGEGIRNKNHQHHKVTQATHQRRRSARRGNRSDLARDEVPVTNAEARSYSNHQSKGHDVGQERRGGEVAPRTRGTTKEKDLGPEMGRRDGS